MGGVKKVRGTEVGTEAEDYWPNPSDVTDWLSPKANDGSGN